MCDYKFDDDDKIEWDLVILSFFVMLVIAGMAFFVGVEIGEADALEKARYSCSK